MAVVSGGLTAKLLSVRGSLVQPQKTSHFSFGIAGFQGFLHRFLFVCLVFNLSSFQLSAVCVICVIIPSWLHPKSSLCACATGQARPGDSARPWLSTVHLPRLVSDSDSHPERSAPR